MCSSMGQVPAASLGSGVGGGEREDPAPTMLHLTPQEVGSSQEDSRRAEAAMLPLLVSSHKTEQARRN